MPQHEIQQGTKIYHPGLLLVEGRDDESFFRQIIERRNDQNMQIIRFDGKDNLGEFLTNNLIPRLKPNIIVKTIGIVRDADNSYERAFQSIGDSLRTAGLPSPPKPLTYADGMLEGDAIRVIAYVMPDNNSNGDLESLCLKAVSESPAMACVDYYFDCLKSINHVPRQESKARLRAFLSANQDNPNLLIGHAIAADVLRWDSPAFAEIHRFLDLMSAT